MAKSGNRQGQDRTAPPAGDPWRMPDFSEVLSANPLSGNPIWSNPMAAFTATTMIGLGIANEMANVFFGALQSTMETMNRSYTTGSSTTGESATDRPAATSAPDDPAPVEGEPVKPSPPRKAKAGVETSATSTAAKRATKSARKVKAADSAADLKRISGIGPKLEKILKEKGVASLSDIAAWTEADVVRFDRELQFEGRIARDGWVGQAQALLK